MARPVDIIARSLVCLARVFFAVEVIFPLEAGVTTGNLRPWINPGTEVYRGFYRERGQANRLSEKHRPPDGSVISAEPR
jgi:hypothetical protein